MKYLYNFFFVATSSLCFLVACGSEEQPTSVTPPASVNSLPSDALELSSSSLAGKLCDVTDMNYFVDVRDGQTYRMVKIGEQVWMAENLNYETATSYCYNCTKYGRLYTWSAAMDSAGTWSTNGKGCGDDLHKVCSPTYPVRGICPEGWHLPDSTEWNTLFIAVGGSDTAGKMLKSTSGWNEDGNGTDAYCFSALPAGCRFVDDLDYRDCDEGRYAGFWTSNDRFNASAADFMVLGYNYDYAGRSVYMKNSGYSVRCIKD